MALTKTSLSAGCGADDLKLRVTSAAGATPNCLVQIGDEFAVCTAVDGNVVSVRSRGSQATVAKAHSILAPVTFGLAVDFPVSPGNVYPRSDWDVREVAVDQDFDPGIAGGKNLTRNTEVLILKAAWAQLITAPSQGQDGLQVRFVSTTAGPHLITYTAGFAGSGATSDIATVTGIGSSVTIRAQNGVWGVVATGGSAIA